MIRNFKAFDIFIIITLALLICVLFNNIWRNRWELNISPNFVNFGTVLVGNKLEIKTSLSNDTDEAIIIADIKPSCVCVQFKLDRTVIPSKGKAQLIVSESTLFEKDISRSLIISYKKLSQASPKEITFTYFGKTVSPIRSKEITLDAGAIPFNTKIPYKMEVTLYKQETPLQWDNLSAETKDSYISLLCKKESENRYLLQVSLDPAKQAIGNFFSEIKFHFINKGIDTQYQYAMPVTGRITSDVKITPKTVYLGAMDLNETKKGKIELSSGVRNIELSSVSSDDPDFMSIKSYEQTKNSLILNYEAVGRNPGDKSCAILVTIGGNPKQKIAIPIIAYVKSHP